MLEHVMAPYKLVEVLMSVRKRTWKTARGESRSTWVVDYTDQLRTRHLKSFDKKKDADAHHAQVAVDVRAGIHTADSRSITVAEAGALWLKSKEAEGIEPTSINNCRGHLKYHIEPLIGATKLSALTVPFVREFEDRLRQNRSPGLVGRVLRALAGILDDAMDRGLVAQNVARRRRTRNKNGDRHKQKLTAGVDIPLPDEIRAVIAGLNGDWRPALLTAIFTGLRACELRGLPWSNVDLARNELHVRQRADRYGRIGSPKSAAGRRTIPLPPLVANALREWKLRCAGAGADLMFPGPRGKAMSLSTLDRMGWQRAQVVAGITTATGEAKYTGFHALRHFYASWCINRKVDGGLELPLKVVQTRLGHASIKVTADTYGHLFPRGDDGSELAAAEQALYGGDRA
jgi:integrase